MELGKKNVGRWEGPRSAPINVCLCLIPTPAGCHGQLELPTSSTTPSSCAWSPAQAGIPWLGREILSPAAPPAPSAPCGGAAGLILDEVGFI